MHTLIKKIDSMKELENKILKYLKDRNWDNLKPVDLAKSIMIEGAELLEHFQWEAKTLVEVKKDKKKLKEIGEELADVLIYALQMSILLGLNTEKIIQDKLNKVSKKYPAKLMRDSQNNNTGAYLKIKKQYRTNKNK